MNSFKKARLIQGWTQVELAQKLHVSPLSVVKWESGNSLPNPKRFRQVADVLNTTVAELLKDQEAG